VLIEVAEPSKRMQFGRCQLRFNATDPSGAGLGKGAQAKPNAPPAAPRDYVSRQFVIPAQCGLGASCLENFFLLLETPANATPNDHAQHIFLRRLDPDSHGLWGIVFQVNQSYPMKRLRLDRITGQLLVGRARICCSPAALRSARPEQSMQLIRAQSTAALLHDSADAHLLAESDSYSDPSRLPSPLPERALESIKLAALHARLTLPQKIPLQTLARTLVDASADENPHFNNTNLAFVGQTIINFHVAEWIMCRYPRLPMAIVWEAMKGYAGTSALFQVAQSWGVEMAAVPGGEVDPGLLQFSVHKKPSNTLLGLGYRRKEADYLDKYKWRRGISNRVVFDDDFGDSVDITPTTRQRKKLAAATTTSEQEEEPSYTSYGTDETHAIAEQAHARFVRAVIGALYTHCGRETAKAFIKAHILFRTLDLAKMFKFEKPTVELATLCAREDFEPPVARLLSETGRLSRTPVFVVGIYSGKDKLGEGAAASLDAARLKAAIHALKSWYLYSPGEGVRVPSDMLQEDAKPWESAHIDMGEIITSH